MKILLVSQSILPYKGGSSIIVENLAKNFSKEEMIVLGSRRLRHPRTGNRPKFHYFLSELSFFGRGARFFNWFRKLRFEPLKEKIRQLVKNEGIEYIIGVYPNSFYCLAACEVAKELGIPFSSYFHNTYVENTAINEPDAQAIQETIFENSEHIFVMSKGMQTFYQEKYQMDKFIPLVHTFNERPIISGLNQVNTSKKIKLVAIGNFNESNLEATKRFLNAIKDDERFSFSIYTHVPKVLLQQRGIDIKAIDYRGFIHPDDIHAALQEFDICVLTHGFEGGYGEIEYRTIFPTRTIPMLLSGKPIFAHSPPHSFLSTFIKENNCAELIEIPEEKEIIAGLLNIIENEARKSDLVNAAAKTIEQFYGPSVATFLKHTLKK